MLNCNWLNLVTLLVELRGKCSAWTKKSRAMLRDNPCDPKDWCRAENGEEMLNWQNSVDWAELEILDA